MDVLTQRDDVELDHERSILVVKAIALLLPIEERPDNRPKLVPILQKGIMPV